ncbi:MAG: hypothetical protein QOJ76_3067, partial [Acidobacteriota bacterium]|nr:hypothetical protein [Acidobacteriota bacterium]
SLIIEMMRDTLFLIPSFAFLLSTQ